MVRMVRRRGEDSARPRLRRADCLRFAHPAEATRSSEARWLEELKANRLRGFENLEGLEATMLRCLEKLRGLRTSEMVRSVTRRPLGARRLGARRIGSFVACWLCDLVDACTPVSLHACCVYTCTPVHRYIRFLVAALIRYQKQSPDTSKGVAWWPDS